MDVCREILFLWPARVIAVLVFGLGRRRVASGRTTVNEQPFY
jgi:hypothetical protein